MVTAGPVPELVVAPEGGLLEDILVRQATKAAQGLDRVRLLVQD